MTFPLSRWDLLRPSQIVVYCGLVAAGVHGLVLGSPPNAVTQAMGHTVALTWTVMLIVCPVVAFVGMRCNRSPAGAWLQIGGALGVAFATAAYAVAVFSATWAQSATFAAWMAVSLSVCAWMAAVRDARRWWLVTRLAREMSGDGHD